MPSGEERPAAYRWLRVTLAGAIAICLSLVGASQAGTSLAWPGGPAVNTADGTNVFGKDLSGLAYQPSGTSDPGVLWAVRNNPSSLFRLEWSGTRWAPDTANGWSAGKGLRYPGGTGAPDAEGVTIAETDPDAVYVVAERDGTGLSDPAILRYDVSGGAATLTATDEFDLSADLPGLPANDGPEAITWIPDADLVADGFVVDSTSQPYDPTDYANHGSGLFFIGIEGNGQIIAYALNSAIDGATRVAAVTTGLAGVMALEYEPESGLLWAVCDDTCGGTHRTFAVTQDGGSFEPVGSFARPPEMPDLNNEGFAIAAAEECEGGLKPAIWTDDGNTASHALRAGTVDCGPPGPDTRVDGSVSAAATQTQRGRKIAIKATVSATEDLSARAAGKVKAGRASYGLKQVTRGVGAGASTVLILRPAKAKDARKIAAALAGRKAVTAKLTFALTDGADNTETESVKVKLKG